MGGIFRICQSPENFWEVFLGVTPTSTRLVKYFVFSPHFLHHRHQRQGPAVALDTGDCSGLTAVGDT